MRKTFILTMLMLFGFIAYSQQHDPHYIPYNEGESGDNVSVFADLSIDGKEIKDENIEVGLFIGDVCWGNGFFAPYDWAPTDGTFSITVQGKGSGEKTFLLRLYDHSTGKELYYTTEMQINTNLELVGTIAAPESVPFSSEAKIGDTYYTIFKDAIDAAQTGDAVVVLRDISIGNTNINKAITITADSENKPTVSGRFYVECTSGGTVKIENMNFVTTDDAVQIKDCTGTDVVINNCNISGLTAQGINLAGTVQNMTVNGCTFTKKSSNVVAVTTEAGIVTGTLTFTNNDASNAGRTIYVGKAENVYFMDNVQGYTKIKLLGNIGTVTFEGSGAGVADWSGNISKLIVKAGVTGFTPSTTKFEAKIEAENGDVIYYGKLADAFAAAQNGDEVKVLKAGTYALSTSGKDITIIGNVDGVVFDNIGAKNMNGANVTFNNVTFDYYQNKDYTGLQHSGNLVYNNCTFEGQVFLYGVSETFNTCTFNQNSSGAYNVWTYGAKDVDFNNCTFNSAGKSVLIYSEDKNLVNNVDVTGCEFKASSSVEGEAAIEMDSSLTSGINLTITNTTANDFDNGSVSGNSLWNNKKGNADNANNDITVVVDNVTVLEPIYEANVKVGETTKGHRTLKEAIAAATAGATVTMLADASYTEILTLDKAITLDGGKLDGGNFKLTTSANRAINVDTDAAVTIKNLNVVGGTATERGINIIKPATVNLDGVNVSGITHYALNITTNGGAAKVSINNSDLTGYSALNVWGEGAEINVENSNLTGVNNYNGETNSFAVIAVAAKNVKINVSNGENNFVKSDANSDQKQWIFCKMSGEGIDITGLKLTLNTKLALEGDNAVIAHAPVISAGAEVAVRAEYASQLNQEGFVVSAADENGLVSVKGAVNFTITEGENTVGYYNTFAEALEAVEEGQTIVIVEGATGSEIGTEIDFEKEITFTVTGNAPNYAWPVVTFQNATVNIKDATILTPELDARQNATINVINSTVYDAGGNSIVKSYFNGAINIDNSTVYTMQMTTMGYINIKNGSTVTATWQTNVYGNGLVTVDGENTTFNTAAIHITGQDYSERDNTDKDRVDQPAEVLVNAATVNIGKAYSSSGADYSYNSSKGINIGTVTDKYAVLNATSGAKVNIFMANGEKTNIGAGGTVNIAGSVLQTSCRTENGSVTVANAGTINVSGESDLAANVTGDGWVYMKGVKLSAATQLDGAKVRFASGENFVNGSTIDDGWFQVGIGAYNGTDANVDTENGVTVTVNNAVIGSKDIAYAGWLGTGYYDTDDKKAAAMNDARYTLIIYNSVAEFGYLHISNDGILNVNGVPAKLAQYNNSQYAFRAGDFIINGTANFDATDVLAFYTKVSCDNGTDKPGTINILNGTEYESEPHNGGTTAKSMNLYKTGVVNVSGGSTLEIGDVTTIAADAKLNIADATVNAIGAVNNNNGTIALNNLVAKMTTTTTGLTLVSGLEDYTVIYANGAYTLAKSLANVTFADETVKVYTSLQAAINAATDGAIITLLQDITEDVTVVQAENVKITINGDDHILDGTVTVDGKSARYETAGLTIKEVSFKAPTANKDYCIQLGDGTNATRYTNNVTVENCTFTGEGDWAYNNVAAVRSRTGGDWNLVINNCIVTDLHSLVQVPNVEKGLAITNNDVAAKNGINLNSTTAMTFTGNTFNVNGYAIRAGVNSGGNPGAEKNFVIEDNNLTSACADGDAVIMLRASAANASMTIAENVMNGANHISGVTNATNIVADANYWGEGAQGPKVNDEAVNAPTYGGSVQVYSYYTDAALTNLETPARGDQNPVAYITGAGNASWGTSIWGETWGNATESFVIKVLDAGGNVMGTTTLQDVIDTDHPNGFIDGDVTATWNLKFIAANSDYWVQEWTTRPTIDNQPAKIALYIDGIKVSEGPVQFNAPDNLNKIVAAVTDAEGCIVGYASTLAAALDNAKDGETVNLLWKEGDAAIAMNGKVCGNKTVTITGTALVDWTKGNLMIGRDGEGNGKCIFDNAIITSFAKANPASTGFHVSGNKGSDNTVNNGELVIQNGSNIEVDYLINRYSTTVTGNSTLTVYGGCWTHGRPANESGTETDATATMTIDNGSTVNVINENGMGVGGEGNGCMTVNGTYKANILHVRAKGTVNIGGSVEISGITENSGSITLTDANATFKTTPDNLSVATTVENHIVQYEEGTYKLVPAEAKVTDAEGNTDCYITFAEALAAAEDGDTVTLLANIEMTTHTNITKNITLDLNGKTITSTTHVLYINQTGATIKNGTVTTTGSGIGIYSYGSDESVNVVNVENVNINSKYWGIYHNGNNYGINLTVTGGTITDTHATGAGIFLSASDNWETGYNNTLTVTGAKISGMTAVEVKRTNVKITGSTLTENYTETSLFKDNANGACAYGYAFALTNNGADGATIGELNLSNNTINGAVGIKIGGEVNVTIENPEAVPAPAGYAWYHNEEDNTYELVNGIIKVDDIFYASWADADDHIVKNSKIKLYRDIRVEVGNQVNYPNEFKFPANGGNIYLELNGFDLIFDEIKVTVQSNIDLRITDASAEKVGITFTKGLVLSNNVDVYIDEDIEFSGDVQFNPVANAGNFYIGETCWVGRNGIFKTVKQETADAIITTNITLKDDYMTLDFNLGSLVLTQSIETLANQNITVDPNATLSIANGVTLKLNPGTVITVNGTVNGEGTIAVNTQAHLAYILEKTQIKNINIASEIAIADMMFDRADIYYTNAENLSGDKFITAGKFDVNVTDLCVLGYKAVQEENVWVVKPVQLFELNEGWNWFSSYVDLSGTEGLTKLQTALANNATQIKGKDESATFGSAGVYDWWSGGLQETGLSNTEMYMIKMNSDANNVVTYTIELAGDKVNLVDTDIILAAPTTQNEQLIYNWTWIPYLLEEGTGVSNVFNGIAATGDHIKGHTSFAMCYEYGGNKFWYGSLNTMEPGQGYIYKSTTGATLNYSQVNTGNAKGELKANVTTENNRYRVNAHQYPGNMNIVATLSVNGEMMGEDYEVAAFVNGECRGSARPIYVEPLDAYMFFLTIHGDDVEQVTFRYIDLATGEEYALNERINYSNDAVLGTIAEPYVLSYGTMGIDGMSANTIAIYPNPTTTDREINLQTTCDKVEVFNALGVKIAEYQNVDTIDAFETAGIYVIRITNNNSVQHCRLIVK